MKIKLAIIVLICISNSLFFSCGTTDVAKTNIDENSSEILEFQETSIVQNLNYSEDKIFFKPSTPTEFKDKKIIEDYEICEYETEMNLEGVSKYTDNIITAKVNGFSYTSLGTPENGKDAWTIINVTVTENIKGTVNAGENIDIYTFGGYISLRDKLGNILYAKGGKYGEGNKLSEEEIDNTVYHQFVRNGELPIVGEEYAFYLAKGNSLMSENSYMLVGGENGILLKVDNKFLYRRIEENNEVNIQEYSYDDLIK